MRLIDGGSRVDDVRGILEPFVDYRVPEQAAAALDPGKDGLPAERRRAAEDVRRPILEDQAGGEPGVGGWVGTPGP